MTSSRTFEITKEDEYPSDYVVLDFETNGLNPKDCDIIQMAAIRYRNDIKVSRFVSFVNATVIPPKVTELTSITVEDCQSAPTLDDLLPQLLDFIGEDVIVAHNASFDLGFLIESMKRLNLSGQTFIYVDTLRLARQKIKGVKWYKLPILKKYLKLEYTSHLAEDDCYVCHEVYKYCRGLTTDSKEFSTIINDKFEILELNNSTLIDEQELNLLIDQAKHYEDEGHRDDAIDLYEQCISYPCMNEEPYDRLILLYRKKREKENEIRVLELAIQLFQSNDKYQLRLHKILSK
ncbi:exonuclease domain-containing protein [Turicibacter sanguinis]|uniref:exonuclease domain-containing protein n=1 Tax=Turicibacter sanguinis TaxID=154288 RepID=UPI00232C5232|nr:exonuclease domain-containing protein [Turicibacter sanguinis]MDB8542793.1 exonuclease domain-containing protein [Turicibacter sanguinis]